MQASRPTLILTRPRHQSEALAKRLRGDLGDDPAIILSPLIEVVALTPPDPFPTADTLVFTSINGVRHYPDASRDRGKPAYCVGARTAEAARAAGFDARSADGDADGLVALITREAPDGAILHAHGWHHRGDVVPRLVAAGLSASGIAVYDQPESTMDKRAQDLLCAGGPCLVPLFSPRTAALFAKAAPVAHGALILCMSDAVSAELDPSAYALIRRIAQPDGAIMYEAILRGLSGGLSP